MDFLISPAERRGPSLLGLGLALLATNASAHPHPEEEWSFALAAAPELISPPPPHERHSMLSAGSGGLLFIASETMVGAVSGVMLGAALGARDGREYFPWFLGGGVVVGGLATALQYSFPIGTSAASLSILGSGVGLVTGLGVLAAIPSPSVPFQLGSILIAMHAGSLAPVLLSPLGDYSGGDALLIGSSTLYVFAVTGMTIAALRGSGVMVPPVMPLLFAPAVGMAAGGALAALLELPAQRVSTMTWLPLGVGGVVTGLGLWMTGDYGLSCITGLVSVGLTLGVTAAFAHDGLAVPGLRAKSDGPRWTAVPMILATGKRGDEIAPGGGVVVAF